MDPAVGKKRKRDIPLKWTNSTSSANPTTHSPEKSSTNTTPRWKVQRSLGFFSGVLKRPAIVDLISLAVAPVWAYMVDQLLNGFGEQLMNTVNCKRDCQALQERLDQIRLLIEPSLPGAADSPIMDQTQASGTDMADYSQRLIKQKVSRKLGSSMSAVHNSLEYLHNFLKEASIIAKECEQTSNKFCPLLRWRMSSKILNVSKEIEDLILIQAPVAVLASTKELIRIGLANNEVVLANKEVALANHKMLNRINAQLPRDQSTQAKVSVHQCWGLPKYRQGLEQRGSKVQELLKNVKIVGIVGMGGVGKTTISKFVFNATSRHFEYTCFVDNVKDIPSHDLGDRLLSNFYHNGTKATQIDWSQLKTMKTLIVLDDVDSVDQLKILHEFDDFGEESRFIITSRDPGILKMFDVENYKVYDVEFLEYDDAKVLFCHYAFGQASIPSNTSKRINDLDQNVMKMVKKCNGLPLTLEIMGSHLRGHSNKAKFWEETIRKLGKAAAISGNKNDRVWASLRLSFDALSQEEQQMFVEAGTYFFEQPIERALSAWSTAYEFSNTSWTNLLSKSMVKKFYSNCFNGRGPNRKTVWVHEHLRDLAKNVKAINMVCGHDEEADRVLDLLNENKLNPETSILQLSYSYGYENRKTLKLQALDKLEKLKYLELVGVPHEGTWRRVPKKLSLLKWRSGREGQPRTMEPLPINLERMKSLAVLKLNGWKVTKEFPEALGNLVNLRILSLCHLVGLDSLPEKFSDLSHLKRLKLKGIGELKELGNSFGNLSALKSLCLTSCDSFERLPTSFESLSDLKELELGDLKELRELGDSFGNLPSLKSLCLTSCDSFERLPANFGRLSALEKLELEELKELKELGDSFGNLSALKSLVLNHMSLERFPANFGHLCALKDLKVLYSSGLQNLPDKLGQLTALTTLRIIDRGSLEAEWDNIPFPRSLQQSEISSCELKRLPESIGNLSETLQCLELSCTTLEVLPESLGKLSSLQVLSITSNMLQRLPESLEDLSSLRKLFVGSTRSLPEGLGKLSSLQELDIFACDELKSLPEVGDLSSLERLQIQSCKNLETLPDTLGSISSLREILLWDCPKLLTLPDSLRQFSQIVARKGLWLLVKRCPFLDD